MTSKSPLPSPSTSPIAIYCALGPGKSTLPLKFSVPGINGLLLKVGRNIGKEKPVKPEPAFNTVTWPNVASTGTVTVSAVADAEVTVAFVAPKYTMSFAAVVLNPVPVMFTEDNG